MLTVIAVIATLALVVGIGRLICDNDTAQTIGGTVVIILVFVVLIAAIIDGDNGNAYRERDGSYQDGWR